jgi:hypothetical protein
MTMKLTMKQLLLLNNLIYLDGIEQGIRVGEIAAILLLNLPKDSDLENNRAMLRAILQDQILSLYYIGTYLEDEYGMRVMSVCDDLTAPSDVNVVFRGTANDEEWRDNAQLAYLSDTPAQERAADYVIGLPSVYGTQICVTGHSKGGNKAQYVTIVTDRVGYCLSFDGPGFSPEFLTKYETEILNQRHKITTVAAQDDFVNCLLYSIAQEEIFLKNRPEANYLYHHKPYAVFTDDFELLPRTRQGDIPKEIHDYNLFLLSHLNQEEREYVATGLVEAIIALEDQKWSDPTTLLHIVLASAIAVGYLVDKEVQEKSLTHAKIPTLWETELTESQSLHMASTQMADSYFRANPTLLRLYAKRLEKVNNRLGHLGNRLYQMSIRVDDADEIWEILTLEGACGRHAIITRTVSFLFKTAEQLEGIETQLLSQLMVDLK